MAFPTILSLTVCLAVLANADTRDERSIGDMAANLFQQAVGTVIPDATVQACLGLGWVKKPNKRALFDSLIPSAISQTVGQGFGLAFPASMQDSFCTQANMIKPGANNNQQYTPQPYNGNYGANQGAPQGGGVQYVYDPPVEVSYGQYQG